MEKGSEFRRILWVFLGLVALTIIEFIISQVYPSAALLFIVALAKATLVINYFMHIYRLWRQESH